MNKKQLTAFYKTCANLYGVIYSDDAFDILKTFFPKYLKKDFIKDLKERWNSGHRGYNIVKVTGKTKYFITFEYCDDDEIIDYILQEAKDKPYFIPEGDFDNFIKYSNKEVSAKDELLAMDEFKNDLDNITPDYNDLQKARIITMLFYFERLDDYLHELSHLIETKVLPPINEEGLRKIAQHLMNVFNNRRLFENRGYTPAEMSKMYGLDDPVKVITAFIKTGLKEHHLKESEVEDLVNSLTIDEDIKSQILLNFNEDKEKFAA